MQTCDVEMLGGLGSTRLQPWQLRRLLWGTNDQVLQRPASCEEKMASQLESYKAMRKGKLQLKVCLTGRVYILNYHLDLLAFMYRVW